MKKLMDVCDIQYGYAFDSKKFSNDSSFIPLIRIRDVKRGYSETFYSGTYSKEYIVHRNDLLIGMDGEFNIARWNSNEALLNQRVCKIVAKNGTNEEYLRFAMSRKLKEIEEKTSFVTVKHLSAKELKKIVLKMPNIEKQSKISNILVKLEDTIKVYKKELEKLNSLIQARFVEMFGDPVQNTKGWSIDTCKNLTSKIGSGATPKGGRESYCTEGIAFVRSMNVYNNRFEYGDLAFINDEQANKLSNVTVEHKDVLLNITGASVARCCIVPDELIPARVNQHVAIVRCKEKILPEFLCSMFTEDNYQKLLWRIATSGGATREAITKQQIENLVLIVPPMKLQEDYARFSERVNKSKFVIHKFLYCTTHNTQSIIKPRPNTKESGKTRGGKPYADEF